MKKIIKIHTDPEKVKDIEEGRAGRWNVVCADVEVKPGKCMKVHYARHNWLKLKLIIKLLEAKNITEEQLEELWNLAYDAGHETADDLLGHLLSV